MSARTWLAILNVISLVLIVGGGALAVVGFGSMPPWLTAALPGIPALVFSGTIPALWLLYRRTPKSDPVLEGGVGSLDDVLRCVQADLGSCAGTIGGLQLRELALELSVVSRQGGAGGAPTLVVPLFRPLHGSFDWPWRSQNEHVLRIHLPPGGTASVPAGEISRSINALVATAWGSSGHALTGRLEVELQFGVRRSEGLLVTTPVTSSADVPRRTVHRIRASFAVLSAAGGPVSSNQSSEESKQPLPVDSGERTATTQGL